MTKDELIEKIIELLNSDKGLHFLSKLETKELETLVASIRDRVDYLRNS